MGTLDSNAELIMPKFSDSVQMLKRCLDRKLLRGLYIMQLSRRLKLLWNPGVHGNGSRNAYCIMHIVLCRLGRVDRGRGSEATLGE